MEKEMNIFQAIKVWRKWKEVRIMIKSGNVLANKTNLTIVVAAIFDIFATLNVVLPEWLTRDSVVATVNVVAGLLAVMFNYIGRKAVASRTPQ